MSDGISETVVLLHERAESVVWGTTSGESDESAKAWAEKFVTVPRADLRTLLAAYESAVRERETYQGKFILSETSLTRAIAQRDRARAALRKYGVHAWDCDSALPDPDHTCTCGLDAATEDA